MELYGIQITGFLAWILRILFFLYFMPLKRNAVRVVLEFFSTFITGRFLVPVWSSRFPENHTISTVLDTISS
ncbi:hypothetical protein J2S04_001785 [Alicyclobacillus tengchongensis]|uniref:YggT family protein n=1 Tax=Alicyclobacillus tolerans TaxID=90970 RepID=A0ABT9LX47_9BACL|nr:hypothetical protein [Alicyclobacillus tengchongensis]